MAEATESDTLNLVTEKNKFDNMRDNLDQKFSELTSLVNQKKLDLDRKIDDLELEYNNKNKQIEKDRETLIRLREHNAQELSQNSLIELQENLNEEIADKIQELTTELEKQLKLELTINWSYNVLQKEIAKIDIKLIKPIYKSPPTFESSDEELEFYESVIPNYRTIDLYKYVKPEFSSKKIKTKAKKISKRTSDFD